MKKILLLIVAMAMAVIVAGCASDDKSDEGADNKESVEYVSPGHILERIDNKDTFAFVIGDATCSACNHYKETTLPEMQEKDGITLEFIELHEIEDRKQDEKDVITIIEDHLDGQFEATPTTYFMVDGELVDIIVGAAPYEDLINMYETHIVDTDTEEVEGESEETEEVTEETSESEKDVE